MMKRVIISLLLTTAIAFASCSKDDVVSPVNETNKTGAISISIKGDEPETKALSSPTPEQEKMVKNFTVYVFSNATGAFEKSATFTDGFEGRVTGLGIASSKKVVVLVNKPDDFPTISHYSDFAKVENMIHLDTQGSVDFIDSGLFMSGEYATPVELSAEETVKITVVVKRLTAKVRIGTLSVNPAIGQKLSDFSLTGISIQKARDNSPALGGLANTGYDFVSGIAESGNAIEKNYLHDLYSLPSGYVAGTPLNPNICYYIFPNDNSVQATLLTVYGTYLGQKVYYTFNVNDKVSNIGGNLTDGKFIERNKVYTVNVKLQKLGNGGEDPNIPNQEVDMDAEIVISDWDDELIHEVEW